MKPLVNLTMFRGYVNKILPTVYDDSLSYYEVLAKVMAKLNEVIELDNKQNEIINNLPLDVSSFAEELAEFKADMTQQFNDYKEQMNASLDAFEDEINAKIVTDSAPTEGSTNLVTSGGVYAALKDITDSLIKDALPTQGSDDFVTSGGVYTAIQTAVDNINTILATKQNTLTFDTTPTENSTNPVQSGGIKTYVDTKTGTVQNNLNTYITNNDRRSAAIESDITDLETGKQDTLNFDTVPTLNSQNPVTSDGIARAIAGVSPEIDIDPTPTSGSTNAVSSNGVYVAVNELSVATEQALEEKQNLLNFDVMPTQNSLNPVTSGGVWQAMSQIDPTGTIDPEPTEGSTAAVSSGGTWSALQQLNSTLSSEIDTKQDALVFDNTPTINSGHPVTSDGIYRALQEKQSALTFDSTPTQYSTNPVTSGGVYDAIQGGGGGGGTIDPTPTEGSTNAVSSGGVYSALQGKQNTLTFDSTPTQNSLNPVTSGGVWAAIQGGGGGGGVSATELGAAEARSVLQTLNTCGYQSNDGSMPYSDGENRYSVSGSGSLTRFSGNWTGSDVWSWLNQEYIVGEGTLNNNNKPDFIKVGDYISIDCGSHGNYIVYVIGINQYNGYDYDTLGANYQTIDFIFARPWDVEYRYNQVLNVTGGMTSGQSWINDAWTTSELHAYINSSNTDYIVNSSVSASAGQLVDFSTTGIYYFLPSELKNAITEKYLLLGNRYDTPQTVLNSDNGVVAANLGKIWLPTEQEIFGSSVLETKGTNRGARQYPFFRDRSHPFESWIVGVPDGQHTQASYMLNNGLFSKDANVAGKIVPCFSVAITNY